MMNEVRIKPLLQYEVTFNYADRPPHTFTADSFVNDDGTYIFYRTSNVIRIYPPQAEIIGITVTPVDDEQVPE
jgi:hypothetical protein